jgi:hypothetical protein
MALPFRPQAGARPVSQPPTPACEPLPVMKVNISRWSVLRYPKSREHLGSVVAIMKLSGDWHDFRAKLDKLHPRYGKPTRLSFEYADEENDDTGKGLSGGRQLRRPVTPAAAAREDRAMPARKAGPDCARPPLQAQ